MILLFLNSCLFQEVDPVVQPCNPTVDFEKYISSPNGSTFGSWIGPKIIEVEGGYAVIGTFRELKPLGSGSDRDIVFMRLDQFGNEIPGSRLTVGDDNTEEYGVDLVEISTNQFICLGKKNSKAWIFGIESDANGSRLIPNVEHTFERSGYQAPQELVRTQDGGVAIAGYIVEDFKLRAWFVKMTSTLEIIKDSLYGDIGSMFDSLIELPDESFVFSGKKDIPSLDVQENVNLWFYKINSRFEPVINSFPNSVGDISILKAIIDDNIDITPTSIVSINSNKFIISGTSPVSTTSSNDGSFLLEIQVDDEIATPVLDCAGYYGNGKEDNVIFDLLLTKDGGLAAVGRQLGCQEGTGGQFKLIHLPSLSNCSANPEAFTLNIGSRNCYGDNRARSIAFDIINLKDNCGVAIIGTTNNDSSLVVKIMDSFDD